MTPTEGFWAIVIGGALMGGVFWVPLTVWLMERHIKAKVARDWSRRR